MRVHKGKQGKMSDEANSGTGSPVGPRPSAVQYHMQDIQIASYGYPSTMS